MHHAGTMTARKHTAVLAPAPVVRTYCIDSTQAHGTGVCYSRVLHMRTFTTAMRTPTKRSQTATARVPSVARCGQARAKGQVRGGSGTLVSPLKPAPLDAAQCAWMLAWDQ